MVFKSHFIIQLPLIHKTLNTRAISANQWCEKFVQLNKEQGLQWLIHELCPQYENSQPVALKGNSSKSIIMKWAEFWLDFRKKIIHSQCRNTMLMQQQKLKCKTEKNNLLLLNQALISWYHKAFSFNLIFFHHKLSPWNLLFKSWACSKLWRFRGHVFKHLVYNLKGRSLSTASLQNTWLN